jgi:hypothetical protein
MTTESGLASRRVAWVLRGAALRGAVASVLLLLAADSVVAQGRPSGAGMSAAPVVSPRVLATWHTSRDSLGTRLDLMVLWRGQAKWHDSAVGVSGSDGMCPGTRDRCLGLLHEQYRVGQVEFEVILDRVRDVAHIVGEVVALDGTNVVLVDRVDGVGGAPLIVAKLRVAADLPALEMDAIALVESDSRLRAFAR